MKKVKESERMRHERILLSNNSATLRTRIVPNKKGYKRIKKVEKDE